MNKKGRIRNNGLSVLGIRDQAHTAQGKWYRQKVVDRKRLNPLTFHTTHTRRRRSNRLSHELAKYSYITILDIIIIIIIHGSYRILYIFGFLSNIGRCIVHFKKWYTPVDSRYSNSKKEDPFIPADTLNPEIWRPLKKGTLYSTAENADLGVCLGLTFSLRRSTKSCQNLPCVRRVVSPETTSPSVPSIMRCSQAQWRSS